MSGRRDEHLWDLGVFRKTHLQQTEIVSVDVIGLGLTVVQRLSLAHLSVGFPTPECFRTVKPWWKKKRKLPGVSLYKEQKRNMKDSLKSMSPPEKPKMCFNIQNALPQCNLLMKQILSYGEKGRDGLQREWAALLERAMVILVK